MKNNFKSFDEDEIPEGLKKVLEQLQAEGTDVSVVRLSSNKKDKKFNNIMSKLQEDNEDDKRRKIKEALNISRDTLAEDIKDIDDNTLFSLLNESYVDLVRRIGRPVTLSISLVITEDGSLQMCTGGLDTKEEVIRAFEVIAKELKKNKRNMKGNSYKIDE